jgi:hypothetical protein
MFQITAAKVARGLALVYPGRYVVTEALSVKAPPFPDAAPGAWDVFVDGRPCVLSVESSDVILDFDFRSLEHEDEHVGGLVLVAVAPGLANVTVTNAVLGRCAVGVLFGYGCTDVAVRMLTASLFAEKAVLAYSPVGLLVADAVLGPNLAELGESQESFVLRAYGDHVTPAGLAGWAGFHDNLLLEERSHVAGVCVVPSADQEAPVAPLSDTGSGVVLERVQVLPLTAHLREHSFLLSVSSDGTVQKARGRLGEPLADWYRLRWWASARHAPLRHLPPLSLCEPPHAFVTDAGGSRLASNQDEAVRTVTTRVVGVDRNGDALRGVQALLFVGCGAPSLTAVTAAAPVLKTLTARLLPCPVRCPTVNLAVRRAATSILTLAAPAASTDCCSRAGAAAQFAPAAIVSGAWPLGAYVATARGSLSGG